MNIKLIVQIFLFYIEGSLKPKTAPKVAKIDFKHIKHSSGASEISTKLNTGN